MKLGGLQKLTLLDFPEHTACTLFTAGCNFRCPFCHNSDLLKKPMQEINENEFFEFLQTRKGKLDGVCISGGEPLLQTDIIEFIAKIREMGFLVKIDTNGSLFEPLKEIVENGLCDYVAMDIKNIPEKYSLSCGGMVNVQNVLQSASLLMGQSKVGYEFRTTVVKELNEMQDFKQIAKWLKNANKYFLQQYKHSEKVLKQGYSAYSDSEMHQILNLLKQEGMQNCYLRGIE